MRRLFVVIYLLIALWLYLQEVPFILALLWPLTLIFIACFVAVYGL